MIGSSDLTVFLIGLHLRLPSFTDVFTRRSFENEHFQKKNYKGKQCRSANGLSFPRVCVCARALVFCFLGQPGGQRPGKQRTPPEPQCSQCESKVRYQNSKRVMDHLHQANIHHQIESDPFETQLNPVKPNKTQ